MIIYLDKDLIIEKVVHREPFFAGAANSSTITVITEKKDLSYTVSILFKRPDGAIVGPYSLKPIVSGYEILLSGEPLLIPGELKFTIRFEKYAIVDGYPQVSQSIPAVNLAVNINYAVVIGGETAVDLSFRIFQAFQMIEELSKKVKNDTFVGDSEPSSDFYNTWLDTSESSLESVEMLETHSVEESTVEAIFEEINDEVEEVSTMSLRNNTDDVVELEEEVTSTGEPCEVVDGSLYDTSQIIELEDTEYAVLQYLEES